MQYNRGGHARVLYPGTFCLSSYRFTVLINLSSRPCLRVLCQGGNIVAPVKKVPFVCRTSLDEYKLFSQTLSLVGIDKIT